MFGLLHTTQVYSIQHQEKELQLQQLQQPLQFQLRLQQAELNRKSLLAVVATNTKTKTRTFQNQRHEYHEHQSNLSPSLSSAATSSTNLTYRKLFTKKSTANFLEKFLKSDQLNGGIDTYDTLNHYKDFHIHHNKDNNNNKTIQVKRHSDPIQSESLLSTFDCLYGSYRHNFDDSIYESNNTTAAATTTTTTTNTRKTKTTIPEKSIINNEMTIKYSRHLLDVEPNEIVTAATLQNYQKIPESINDLINGNISRDGIDDNATIIGSDNNNLIQSSGASSGEFNCSSDATTISYNASGGNSSTSTSTSNSISTTASIKSSTSASSNLYKRLVLEGGRPINIQKSPTKPHNPSRHTHTIKPMPPSASQLTKNNASLKCLDLQRRSSSTSSGDYITKYERNKKNTMLISHMEKTNSTHTGSSGQAFSEKMQRRKLIQMVSNYEQQNVQLQQELIKERRRRTEELACVVKSLLCFESKLKTDMKSINQRLLQKDKEIGRLLMQNRALRKRFNNMKIDEGNARDKGVVDDEIEGILHSSIEENELVSLDLQGENDCLVMEALQCINCRKQFYDIEMINNSTQTSGGSFKLENGNRNNVGPTSEHNSSSDETVSSSFFDARRSVRYTSKRTSGTFRDYMRSRAMNIEDPSLEIVDIHSEKGGDGGSSCVSRNESATSYDKLNIYSRTIERLHGVKSESERDSEQSGLETTTTLSTRSTSRASTKSSKSCSSFSIGKNNELNHSLEEEDDGIFSPTQDDDFDEDEQHHQKQQSVVKQLHEEGRETPLKRKSRELFSEASPKQIYETSTDDWYASASDQDETSTTGILSSSCYGQGAINPVLECVNQILLQQSMEVTEEEKSVPATTKSTTTLPRRSSLSDRKNGHCHSQENGNSQSSTLTRKRVHFSTKNSMVHVPRNDDEDDDIAEDVNENHNHNNCANADENEMISNYQTMSSNYLKLLEEEDDDDDDEDSGTDTVNIRNTIKQIGQNNSKDKKLNEQNLNDSIRNVTERLDLLNYESIYSNEYEPIGSEINSSNLYVDMETTTHNGKNHDSNVFRCNASGHREDLCKTNQKLPPALPPKPANLMKFKKKSLEQLIESPEEREENEHEATTTTTTTITTATTIIEPDYCSISEVNDGDVGICNCNGKGSIDNGITSVQIKADVHQPPLSEADDDYLESIAAAEVDIESVTIISDNASQKTDEVEEIFADIPKLPNVAAIIAPKSVINNLEDNKKNNSNNNNNNNSSNNDYLLMNPKLNNNNHGNNKTFLDTSTTSIPTTNRKNLNLNLNPLMVDASVRKDGRSGIKKLPPAMLTPTTLPSTPLKHVPYKYRHGPNIWNEINKRSSLPNSPITSTPAAIVTDIMLQKRPFIKLSSTDLPIQAEFDWYNLDAEYGRSTIGTTSDLLPSIDGSNSVLINSSLSEIQEDGESVITAADEYNLDEEYANDGDDFYGDYEKQQQSEQQSKMDAIKEEKSMINKNLQTNTTGDTNINTSATITSTTMQVLPAPPFTTSTAVRAKKIKKNLENFEKFIESSGLSAKPLVAVCNTPTAATTKRKIYFSGPFV